VSVVDDGGLVPLVPAAVSGGHNSISHRSIDPLWVASLSSNEEEDDVKLA
jgi:hypothetical protein